MIKFPKINLRSVYWIIIVFIVAILIWQVTTKEKQPNNTPTTNTPTPLVTLPKNQELNANVNANANVNQATNTNTARPKTITAPKKPVVTKGFTQILTPHFTTSSIANNATLTSAPGAITLTFNAPIIKSAESFVTVKRDDIYSATRGSSYIGGDGKTLNVNLNQSVQDGEYYVYYVACFTDTGCKSGRLGYHLKIAR